MQVFSRAQIRHTQLVSTQTGERYSFSDVVSGRLGSEQFFIHHDVIPPGTRSSGAHMHSHSEEVVYVVRGEVTAVCGNSRAILSAGSFVLFKPNSGVQHFLLNHTDSNAETVSFSNNSKEDSVIYEKDLAQNAPWTPPTLMTERLILRPVDISDADSIFEYAKNPNVSKYTLWERHQNVQESLDYIRNYIFEYYAKGVPEPLGIALKDNPTKVIGTVGCFWTSQQARSMELAYALAEQYWGQGLIAEASQAVMEYCFKEFSLNRVQARCKVENKASAKVMEKIGMKPEGTLRSAVFHRGRFWDMHYFAKVLE